MFTRITLPTSLKGVKRRLADLDGLLTAGEWEKAAIVYAFTEPVGPGGPPDRAAARTSRSFSEFATLGIAGLKSKDTVAIYHRRWAQAVADGHAEDVKPGQIVILPSLKWDETSSGTQGHSSLEGAKRTIERIVEKHGPAVIVDVTERSEPVRREMTRRAVRRNTEWREEMTEATKELSELKGEIEKSWAKTDTGEDDSIVQELVRVGRKLMELELHWMMSGGPARGAVNSRLAELEATIANWRDRISGESLVLTENDRVWADELGIELGGVPS